MEELISNDLIEVLAHSAIKALITGQPPGPDEWASAATALLKGLLSREAAVDETLARIESKLDQLAQQNFRRDFKSGLYLLNAASREGPGPGWDRDLQQARLDFVKALQATETQERPLMARAIVNWHLAVTYLLMDSLSECRLALLEARDDAAHFVLSGLANWEGSSADYQALVKQRQPAGLSGLLDSSRKRELRLAEAKLDVIQELARARNEASRFQAMIEDIRRMLGEPAWKCRPLRLYTQGLRAEPGWVTGGQPYVFVDMSGGPNEVFHIGIQLHRAVCRLDPKALSPNPKRAAPEPKWFVDLDMELAFPPDAPSLQCVPGASRRGEVAGVSPIDYTPTTLPELPDPRLPRIPLLPDNVFWPCPGITGEPGKAVRGWFRTASSSTQGKPDVVLFRLWPFNPATTPDRRSHPSDLIALAYLDDTEMPDPLTR